jgi:putative zinc finger/helix-turn-helix YgiT family protein
MVNEHRCAVCDSEEVQTVRTKFVAKYNQTSITVPMAEMSRCGKCGERFFTPEQARAVSIAVKNQARKKLGLLSSEEIVRTRKALGLSQAGLEDLFGLGAKVVTRWESGRVVQSKAADVALRLLAADPGRVKELRKAVASQRRSRSAA